MRFMRCVPLLACCLLIGTAPLGGCGDSRSPRTASREQALRTAAGHAPTRARPRRAARVGPQALVTAETDSRLSIVDLRTAAMTSAIALPAGTQYVAAEPGRAVVSSPNADAATLLDGEPLRIARVFGGLRAPHITEISPDGLYGYVTDDARGTLTVIRRART